MAVVAEIYYVFICLGLDHIDLDYKKAFILKKENSKPFPTSRS